MLVQTERAYVGGPISGTPIVNLFLLLSCHDELGGPTPWAHTFRLNVQTGGGVPPQLVGVRLHR